MTRILITGINGFLGRHLCSYLSKTPSNMIIGVGLSAYPREGLPRIDYYKEDLADIRSLDKLIAWISPDYIYHLAGRLSGSAPEIYKSNLLSGLNLIAAMRKHGRSTRLMLVGSAAEYGHIPERDLPVTEEFPCQPLSTYGLSKYAMTLAGLTEVKASGLQIVVARFFNLVGAETPTALVVGGFLQRAKCALNASDGEIVVEMGRMDSVRDFLAVEDAVEGMVKLMELAPAGHVVNICSGAPMAVREVVDILCSFSPRPVAVKINEAFVRAGESTVVYGSFEKARQICGFRPRVPLKSALLNAWNSVMTTENP